MTASEEGKGEKPRSRGLGKHMTVGKEKEKGNKKRERIWKSWGGTSVESNEKESKEK